MPALGRNLKGALLGLALLFAHAQAEVPSAEVMRATLPNLKGKERLVTLLDLANSLESMRPQEALELAKEGLALASKEGDKKREAAFLGTAAYCCTQTGDFSLALEYGKKSLALGTEIGDRDRIARAHNTLGIAYTFIGAYSQALDESLGALRIREELGVEKTIAQSLNLIGIVYVHSGQYEKAIDHFNQILKRFEASKDPKRLILTKLNTGFAQYKLGRLDAALKNHQEALALSREARETTYIPYTYLNLGLTYSEMKRFGQAREYLRLAQAEAQKREQKHGLVQVLRAMARLQLLSGRFAKGISFAKEGAALAQKINAQDELKECYELLSELCGKTGNITESFRYYKLATQVKDSLYSVMESSKFAEASMRVVTLKKDNEIEALKKERVISALQIEKHRYFSIILLSSTAFLVTIVLVLGTYNKKIRQHRILLEVTNAKLESINHELQDKVNEIRTLSGLVPICAHCKKIRDDEGYWNQLEGYISKHTEATFSHGICPDCSDALYPEAMKSIRKRPSPNLDA